MSYGVGHRHDSDLMLLWLWRRPAATALIRPLASEPPYATGVALERPKKKKGKRKYTYMLMHLNNFIRTHQKLAKQYCFWEERGMVRGQGLEGETFHYTPS